MRNKMRAEFMVFMVSLIIVTGTLGFAFAKEVVNLKFYHDTPEWQHAFEEIGELSAERIGITINPVALEDEIFDPRVRMDLKTGDLPLHKYWSGQSMKLLVDEDLAAPIAEVWDKIGNQIVPGLREKLTLDGEVWAAPLFNSPWVWFYNKPVLKEYGLTLPATWEDFMHQCEVLKGKGVTPIAWSPAALWNAFIFFQELLYRYDVQLYGDLLNGKVSWTSEPVVEIMKMWGDMIKKEYFVKPDVHYQDHFPGLLAKRKIAYIPFGSWYSGILVQRGLEPGVDYGIYIMPPIRPEGGKAVVVETSILMVGKHSPQKEDAKKWLTWWMSEEAAKTAWNYFKLMPWNVDIPKEEVAKENPAYGELIERMKDYPILLERYWEMPLPTFMRRSLELFTEFRMKPDSYMDILKRMEKLREEVYGLL